MACANPFKCSQKSEFVWLPSTSPQCLSEAHHSARPKPGVSKQRCRSGFAVLLKGLAVLIQPALNRHCRHSQEYSGPCSCTSKVTYFFLFLHLGFGNRTAEFQDPYLLLLRLSFLHLGSALMSSMFIQESSSPPAFSFSHMKFKRGRLQELAEK